MARRTSPSSPAPSAPVDDQCAGHLHRRPLVHNPQSLLPLL